MATNYHTAYAPEVYSDSREYQDQPRHRLTRDSYFFNYSVIGGLKADLNERIEDGIREIVAEYLQEMIDPEDGNYDMYVAIKMLKRAGFGKYLPPIQGSVRDTCKKLSLRQKSNPYAVI